MRSASTKSGQATDARQQRQDQRRHSPYSSQQIVSTHGRTGGYQAFRVPAGVPVRAPRVLHIRRTKSAAHRKWAKGRDRYVTSQADLANLERNLVLSTITLVPLHLSSGLRLVSTEHA